MASHAVESLAPNNTWKAGEAWSVRARQARGGGVEAEQERDRARVEPINQALSFLPMLLRRLLALLLLACCCRESESQALASRAAASRRGRRATRVAAPGGGG